MDLKGILSISGLPDLYKHIAQSKNGIIVESLQTKKRTQAFTSSKISALEDISIYTEDEDISLKEVLKKIFTKENGNKSISHLSEPDILKKYFAEVLPNYDKEKVFVSDMKRVIKWYNILQEHNLIDLEEEKHKEKIELKTKEKVEEKTEEKIEDSEKTLENIEDNEKVVEKDKKSTEKKVKKPTEKKTQTTEKEETKEPKTKVKKEKKTEAKENKEDTIEKKTKKTTK
jgi:hypothetical protein